MKTDQEVWNLIQKELQRQQSSLQMIPSENYASREVLAACSSVLSNKYAEGYPGRRYYHGNQFIDEVEQLAVERAKQLFGAEHANVQPLSGAPANLAVYFALLQPGDKIMAMNLFHGGHLTHGSPANISGKLYRFIPYGVDPQTEQLDYDALRALALQEKPKIILSGYTAYPRRIDFQKIQAIAEEVGAYSMADISHIAGLVVGGVHPSPLPFTDIVTTTTHKTLRGPRSAMILCKQRDRWKQKYHADSKKNLAQMIDSAVFPGLQGGPHQHTIAAKAICFQEAMMPHFKGYAQQIVRNAQVLAKALMEEGIKLVSNGTDNHLILIDLLKTKSVQKPGMGRLAADALEEAGIVTNANTIPFDPSTPFSPSGVRLGTPALTTRGMKESEMRIIGTWIAGILNNLQDHHLRQQLKQNVADLCRQFPIYREQEN